MDYDSLKKKKKAMDTIKSDIIENDAHQSKCAM